MYSDGKSATPRCSSTDRGLKGDNTAGWNMKSLGAVREFVLGTFHRKANLSSSFVSDTRKIMTTRELFHLVELRRVSLHELFQ